jgi:adenosylmethionine-8-amino-7-oxononanoate aminotransferase
MASHIKHIENIIKEHLTPAANNPAVREVRVLGTIGVIEMKEPVDVGEFQKKCVAAGIWVRPFGRNVYIMPPYVITDEQLVTLCDKLVNLIS